MKIISNSFSDIRDPSGQNLHDFWFYSMYFVFTLSLAHLVLGYLLLDSDASAPIVNMVMVLADVCFTHGSFKFHQKANEL